MPVQVGAKVEGHKAVRLALKGKSLKGKVRTRLNVGYEADHAARIHEDTEMFHENGEAKFLEKPARLYAGQMGKIVKRKMIKKLSLEEATLAAGRFLLEKSQELVPVDTGELVHSGFVTFD
jgi:hypothetical protein